MPMILTDDEAFEIYHKFINIKIVDPAIWFWSSIQ